jgi:hypothetical protein
MAIALTRISRDTQHRRKARDKAEDSRVNVSTPR